MDPERNENPHSNYMYIGCSEGKWVMHTMTGDVNIINCILTVNVFALHLERTKTI